MITFKPLEKKDLSLLYVWLNQAHIRQFYQQKPISLDEVIKKYISRTEKLSLVICYIAYFNGQPMGYIQSYKNCDYPNYSREIGISEGISLDLFIGNPKFLKKGFGQQMLKSYLTNIAFKIYKGEESYYICHETENLSAIAS